MKTKGKFVMNLTEAIKILDVAIVNLDIDPDISMWDAMEKLVAVGKANLRTDVYTAYCIVIDEMAYQRGFNGGY
jgi:hypothetical protein